MSLVLGVGLGVDQRCDTLMPGMTIWQSHSDKSFNVSMNPFRRKDLLLLRIRMVASPLMRDASGHDTSTGRPC
jgi:hypothetical protein